MKNIITVLLMLTAFNAFAQGDTLTAKKAKTKVNKEVIVKALVAGSRIIDKDGKRTLILSLDKPYPKTPMQIIFFSKAFNDLNLQYLLDGKIIVVSGRVTTYRGQPQMVIDEVANFTILSDLKKY